MHSLALMTVLLFMISIKYGASEASLQRQQVAKLQCFVCEDCADDDDQLEMEICGINAVIRPVKTTKKPINTTKKPVTSVTDSEEYAEYVDKSEEEQEVEIVKTTTKKATTSKTTTKKTTAKTTTKAVNVEEGEEEEDGEEDEDGEEEYADLKLRTFVTTTTNKPVATINTTLAPRSGTTTLTALTTLSTTTTSTIASSSINSSSVISSMSSTTALTIASSEISTAPFVSSLATSTTSTSSASVTVTNASAIVSTLTTITVPITSTTNITSIDDDTDYYEEYEEPESQDNAEISRQSRQDAKDEHVCYTIKLYGNKSVITNRGCATLVRRNKYLTCQALSRGLPIKDCQICDTYGCNGYASHSSSAPAIFRNNMWNITSLLAVYIVILFRGYF